MNEIYNKDSDRKLTHAATNGKMITGIEGLNSTFDIIVRSMDVRDMDPQQRSAYADLASAKLSLMKALKKLRENAVTFPKTIRVI